MLSFLRQKLDEEHDRLILFSPVFLGLGALAYFSLKTEPSGAIITGLFTLTALLAFSLRRQRFAYLTACVFLLVAMGAWLAQCRTHGIAPINLDQPVSFAKVSGILESVEQTPKGSKILIKNVVLEGVDTTKTPKHISLTLRSYDSTLEAGQPIALRAGLFPPPQPAVPGGFDFARHYYFREIGAVGYGIPPLTASPAPEGDDTLEMRFTRYRHRLTDAIRSHFTEPAGSVAAAFITGQTQTIPNSLNDEMRTAGLYHLLAVSGMNLSVVAGLAFFTVRLLLAMIPAIVLRYNIKKWAAFVALLVSYLYLEIAGSPLSAERAFLMVSLIFIAIILDRNPAPMRSVALSAVIIICLTPEAVLSSSFQLSYSATAALIASYEWGVSRMRTSGFGLQTLLWYFMAVVLTSLVAWLGTEPFIIYNFNQFSSYSLIANTLAEPLVSFILMPMVIAGLLLMPLGLAGLIFTPMQYGVDALLALAHWVAGLPHAMWIVPAPSDAGFMLCIAGLIWLYFWKTRWRWWGVPAFCLGMSSAWLYTPPDILISSDGKHIATRLDSGGAAMIKGRKDSFIANPWAHSFIEHALEDKKQANLQCDEKGCILKVKGHTIAIPKSPDAVADDCKSAELVIAADFSIAPGTCQSPYIIDQSALQAYGSASVRFEGARAVIEFARSNEEARPWTPARKPEASW